VFRPTTLLVVVLAIGCDQGTLTTSSSEEAPPARDEEYALDLDKGVTMTFIRIPAGSFMMGDDSGSAYEKPAHRVRLTKAFYMGTHEVTQQQWKAVMGRNPCYFKNWKDPVYDISWNDCQDFVVKLNENFADAGQQFGLPTEAQWEYACRAGSTTRYSFGDDEASLSEHAWFAGNSAPDTHPVGQRKPNAWGLYDVHGNVYEWCQDWYHDSYYKDSPRDDPTGPVSGFGRTIRGGCWACRSEDCRSTWRESAGPDSRGPHIGLRIVMVNVK